MLGLALAQYKATETNKYPRLLPLDESLAPLHPSILQKALNIIKRTFSETLGISVIIATHSPSLVALAEEPSLFIAVKDGKKLNLSKATQDQCISQLTVAVPTIRFDPRNRRQIIVEGDIDAFVYTHLFSALRDPAWPSLEFIQAGSKKDRKRPTGESSTEEVGGGCQNVLDLVGKLRANGVTTAHGLIDWDARPARGVSPAGVHVIAAGSRYSIENILLDPALLVLLLAQHAQTRVHVEDLTGHGAIALETNLQRLQSLVDSVCMIIREKVTPPFEEDLEAATYCGGFTLTLPRWAMVTRGHDYAAAVLSAFPGLKKHRVSQGMSSDEDHLIAAIAANFSKDWIRFLPKEVFTTFAGICGHPV